ncbi:hypothetical protein BJ988_005285 [Nocardioides panzhihuensis]|uniref:Uncharacterized protein n=1 Tax=Nocardioides panzhihuensis TaxID=860243 RepID=A0A7Z0DSG0_9ACTN|nr:hypothetical protein [Nocardioides panzhihuensis]
MPEILCSGTTQSPRRSKDHPCAVFADPWQLGDASTHPQHLADIVDPGALQRPQPQPSVADRLERVQREAGKLDVQLAVLRLRVRLSYLLAQTFMVCIDLGVKPQRRVHQLGVFGVDASGCSLRSSDPENAGQGIHPLAQRGLGGKPTFGNPRQCLVVPGLDRPVAQLQQSVDHSRVRRQLPKQPPPWLRCCDQCAQLTRQHTDIDGEQSGGITQPGIVIDGLPHRVNGLTGGRSWDSDRASEDRPFTLRERHDDAALTSLSLRLIHLAHQPVEMTDGAFGP